MTSLSNLVILSKDGIEPKVGMGATQVLWSDRNAFTVIQIKSKCRVLVQRDIADRVDNLGMSDVQDYKYTSDPNGEIIELIKTKRGWKQLHSDTKFVIGIRDEYYDFSF